MNSKTNPATIAADAIAKAAGQPTADAKVAGMTDAGLDAASAKKAADPATAPGKATSTAGNPAGIVKRTNAYYADPKTITRRPGWNPRFDFGEIGALAASIKANGILNDLRVKRIPAGDERLAAGFLFELIDGDRRLTAIEVLLKRGEQFPEGVPVKIVDKGQDDLTSLIQMFEANSSKVFLPMEEAAAYQRMRDAGMSIKKICAATGRAQVHVVETLALMQAGEDLQAAAQDGTVNKTLAKKIAVVAKGDKAKQAELVQQAKDAGKDKTKRTALKKAVDDTRRAKAKKAGKTLKIRALSDLELSEMGAKAAERLVDSVASEGMDINEDFTAWIKADPKLSIAFYFGALEALKAAAGGTNNLAL